MNLKTDSREEYWEYFCKGRIADTMHYLEFGKKKKKVIFFFLHFELVGFELMGFYHSCRQFDYSTFKLSNYTD